MADAAVSGGLHRVETVMGIPVGVDVRDDGVDPAALDRVFAHLRDADDAFSPYRAASDVSRLDAGTLAPAGTRPDVRAVLARCERLRRTTGGWFVAILRAAGARNLCVHAGGDVRVLGERAPGLRWRIGVQHPGERDRLATVLHAPREGLAVATSGAYERGAHIVDPHTGRPPGGVLSVTVAGPELGTADAYATAAFAMGTGGPAWTATLGPYAALTILAPGRMLSTPGMDALRAV